MRFASSAPAGTRIDRPTFRTALLVALALTVSTPQLIHASPRQVGSLDIVATLAAAWRVSERQVEARLDAEMRAIELNQRLLPSYGEGFAGSWFDPQTQRLVVSFTDPTTQSARAARDAGALVIAARRSRKNIDQAAAEVVDQAAATTLRDDLVGTYVDPRENRLIVEVLDSKAEEFLERVFPRMSLSSVDATVIVPVAGRADPLSAILGASEFKSVTQTGQTFQSLCSTGFGVQGGFVTAAHCGFVGHQARTQSGTTIGTFTGSSLSNNFPPCVEPDGDPEIPPSEDACPKLDHAMVTVNSPFWTTSSIVPYTFGAMRVVGTGQALVGTSVCRFGVVTQGAHCGEVTSVDAEIRLFTNRWVPGTRQPL